MAPRETAQATPTKEFFVNMITRDISLEDCILDLLDNTLDGANKVLNGGRNEDYNLFEATIEFSKDNFSIRDNCGGIDIENAKKYAFHFGRRPGAPQDMFGSIGLYGIGMKRAIFKIGKKIKIHSSTDTDSFDLEIDVVDWLSKPNEWNFELDVGHPNEKTGTSIIVTDLKEDISKEFANPQFINKLSKIIARDYSFFLQKGFSIKLNGKNIEPYNFQLKESDNIKPIKYHYTDDKTGVDVDISAGFAGVPPDDTSAEYMHTVKETEYYGWFVICNNRVVLASDKSEKTVWGNNFAKWHPQFNGFMGIVNFHSEEPAKLPWTTTKRDIDTSDSLYKRVLVDMKEATRQFIDYTTARKNDIEKAKEVEAKAEGKSISNLESRKKMTLPNIEIPRKRVRMTTISYQKPLETVKKVKSYFGSYGMSNKEVGIKTFEYFFSNEIED